MGTTFQAEGELRLRRRRRGRTSRAGLPTALSLLLLAAAMLAAWQAPPALAGEAVRLGASPWPPYAAPDLPGRGATATVVEAALAAAGANLVPVFQAPLDLEQGFEDSDLDGIFPVYGTRVRERVCLMSGQIGSSPLGLAERVDAPVTWRTPEDLAGYRIGVVRNYANADPVDRLIARGTLAVVRADSDSANLQNLLDGVIDAAVIDRNVMEWLLRRDHGLAGQLNAVRFNSRPLAERSLHVCFRRDDRGEAARRRLDEGLARVDGPLLTAEWFRRMAAAR